MARPHFAFAAISVVFFFFCSFVFFLFFDAFLSFSAVYQPFSLQYLSAVESF